MIPIRDDDEPYILYLQTFSFQKLSLAGFHDLLVGRCKHQVSHICACQTVMSELGIFIINDGRLNSSPSSSGVSQELSSATTVHGPEMGNRFINTTSNSQETVVLKNDSAVLSQGLGNTLTFLRTKDDSMTPSPLAMMHQRVYL
jgi:hypothetical protein